MEDSFSRFRARAPFGIAGGAMGSCGPFPEAGGDGGEGDKGMDQSLGNGRGRPRELIFFYHASGCSS